MIDALPSLKAAAGISGKDVLAYLIREGWISRPSKVEGVVIVSKESPDWEERAELIVPTKAGESDERRRVADALRTVAQLEGSSEEQVADRILQIARVERGLAQLGPMETQTSAQSQGPESEQSKSDRANLINLASKGHEHIESAAQSLRSLLGIPDPDVFNIVELLENELPKVLSDFRMEVAHGEAEKVYSTALPPRIFLEVSLYNSARVGDAKARITIAHELGHLVLHGALQRSKLGDKGEIERNSLAESQAHKFALAFLIPMSVARGFNDPKLLSLYCKVDQRAAEARMRDVALMRDVTLRKAAARTEKRPKKPER